MLTPDQLEQVLGLARQIEKFGVEVTLSTKKVIESNLGNRKMQKVSRRRKSFSQMSQLQHTYWNKIRKIAQENGVTVLEARQLYKSQKNANKIQV